MSRVLLTGATGYIGSHTWLALLEAGHTVVGLDNFANSSPKVLDRLSRLAGQRVTFEEADVCDPLGLAQVLSRHRIDAAIHFAAYKAVGESVQQPLRYYRNNIGGLLNMVQSLQDQGVFRLVFSSSATVYGQPKTLPIPEDAPLATTNPYGSTKLIGEQLLAELERCDPRWQIARLRYFNPVGAHESGLIGEDPRGVPNNLMPYVCQVAVGTRAELQVYGGDYDTPDGTGVRDYIHVMDLAEGHVASMKHLLDGGGSHVVNLGTGQGHSVLEVVQAFEQASGRPVPYRIVDRRAGDVAACYADPSLARRLLGWAARRSLSAMCEDAWRWQSGHPRGYDG